MRREGLVLVAILVLVSMAQIGLFDAGRLARGIGNLFVFLGDFVPPSRDVVDETLVAILETIQMALVGSVLGFFISLPLAVLAARNISGRAVSTVARFLLAVIRTIPSLLWAIVMVVAFGLGPLAGTIGLSFYAVGYLGKLYYEALEAVDPEVVEAVRAVGSSRIQVVRYALLPEAGNAIWSQLLFMFEYNIRASSILGFVGAGGVGFYMLAYIQNLQYQNLFTVILLTLAVVLAIDYGSSRIRARFFVAELPKGSLAGVPGA